MSRRSPYLNSSKSTIRMNTWRPNKFEDVQEETRISRINYDPVKEIKDLFKLYDKDGNGQISTSEIGSLLFSMGREVTPQEITKMIEEIDKDKSGFVDINEFINYMEPMYKLPIDKIENIVSAFKFFDLDENGYITWDEFRNILTRFGGDFSIDEFEVIFKQIDQNKDGKLDYAEFIDMWKYQ